ncbi:MAG: acyltransferase [Gammaproteobacteria bacterium]
MDTSELAELLNKLYESKEYDLRGNFDRSLSFADGLFDRWERARRLGFGNGTSVYNSSLIYGDVQVGDNTWIGPNTILDGTGKGLSIGSYCSVSAGVQIYTHDSVKWAISGGKAEYSHAPTSIGSRCYIGPNTVISKGVTIGDGCIIGAHSLVLKDIPSGKKAYGVPCQIQGDVGSAERGREN